MALSKTRQEKYKQARDRAKQLGRQIETDQTNRRQSSVGNGSAPSVPGPLGSSSQNAKKRLSGRGVSGVSGSFPVSDAGTAAYERGVVSAITRQRDEAKADQLRAQARLQALSAGGWSADSPQARQAERETWNSLNASARQKAASERLKEIAASAQERYAREQAVRTARLPDADTLESRLEQAARERYQAEANIQRYSGLGLLLSPGGITENAGRLQEAVRAVEPAKERQEALRKDFDAVRNRDYNREQENQINEWIRSTPAGQGTAPDFSTATTPKQWQAAGAVRILLNPDRAAQTVSTGNAEGTWNATRLSFLTEEEKRAVLAYANAGDWETAANLLEALERTLNARQQESANERLYEESKEHPIVGAAANAILSYGQPYAYLEGVRQAAENIATGNYEPIDPNSFAMSGANLVQQTGQGVVDAVNGFFGKDVSFLTQTGLSILQNMARAPIAWVNPMASLGIMATGAGGASVLEGAQAGQDPAKTVALATAAGLAEYVTERVSLESLLETLKAGKTPLRQALFRVGKQMVTEGSEEAASEYLNLLADAVISGASSGMMQERDALMAAGFSRSEADAMAMTKYMAEQPALSALGGMISGGVMGGGAAALGNAMGALDERAQRQADSTAMNENGLVALTAQEQENLSSGKRNKIVSTVQDVVSFIRSALSDRTSSNRAYLGKIPDGTAQRVLEETGVDITGYNAILQSDNIRHIMKKHGDAATESARGQSPVTVEDIAQIPQVLSSPDRISLSNETDSRGRRVLVFEKLIGDNFVTMQAVTDGNHSIQTDTLFKQKRKNPQGTEYNASISASPAHNARSVPPQGSSTSMITEMGLERNGLTREQAEIIARIASGETVSEEEARQVAGSDMATEVLTRTLAERRGAVSEQEPVRRQAGEMARPASRAEAQVIEASSVFGENGRRASRAAYDGSISADRYVSGFAEYYEAGLSGLSMDEVQGRYGRALNEAQRLAAYDSGQRDAAAKLQEERARAQYASTAGTGSGLVLDSYVQQNLDGATVNRLNAVSKALGVRVQFADRVRGGTANASITGSTILVEKGNPNPVLFVVGHEWTHRMQELAPEQYRAFRSAIAGEIQYDARELMARYGRGGVSLTMEEALDEAAADYAGRLLEDGALLDAFIKKHRSDRSLLEKLRDAIRSLIGKLTGKEKQLAETAEGKLTAALEAARRQAERNARNGANTENNAEGKNGARYSFGGINSDAANLQALQKAQEMKESGANMEDIRKETGWHQFADGKWRFEIDDSKMELRMDAAEIPNYILLGNLVDAPELFAAYPDLANIDVTFQSLENGTYGAYSRQFDSIDLDRSLLKDSKELMSSLLHEVQHAIQAREGFARGASVGYWDRQLKKGFDGRTAEAKREGEQLQEAYQKLRERDPQFVKDMDGLNAMTPTVPRGKVDFDTLEQIEPDPAEWVRFDERREQLEAQYGEERVWDYFSLLGDIERNVRNGNRMPGELYRATAGEIEARDTAARRELTAGQRKEKAPAYGDENTVFAKSGNSDSLQEEKQDGREIRRETAEAFQRRMVRENETVDERTSAGYRIGGRVLDFGRPGAGLEDSRYQRARRTQEELSKLGVESRVYLGPVEINRNGKTLRRTITEAANLFRDLLVINAELTTDPVDTAGHEAFHMWAETEAGQRFDSAVTDQLNWGSEALTSRLTWLEERYPSDHIKEELVAYVAGWLHAGNNESELRAILRDYDAVKAAWEALVEENRGEAEETGRYSLKAGDGSRDAAQLRREADLLRDRVEYWKGQTRKSGEISIDGKATRRAARAILRQFSSQLEVDTLTESMTDLYNYMLRGGEDFSETEAYRKAEAIARQVVDGVLEADDSLYSQYADLRAYLRDTPLSISETDRHDIADFNDFRKRNFGRLNIRAKGGTNIDQIYAELSAQWPEFFDQSRESHPADQLLRMAEVAEQLRQVDVRNPFSDSYWEAVQGAANELYQQFFDTPQARKTFADRQAAKLDAERAKGRRRAAEQRERVERQLETVRQQNRERVQRAVQRERETRQRQVERLKDRYAEKTAADRERRSAAELRRKITRHAKALSQKLLHPTDKQHIPEQLRTPVAALLEAINQESLFTYDRSTGKRQKNQPGAPAKRTEAFRALKEQYAKIVAEGGDMVIDPSLLGSDAEGIRGSFDAVITMGDTRLADMNAEQLATVWQVVKAVEHSVSTSGKILSKTKFAATVDWANAMQRDTASRRAKRTLTKGHPLLDLENPYTFFSHFGDAGRDIYRMLRNAQDQQQLMADEVANAVRSIVSPKTVRNMERTTRTFTTERGDKLALSTAQIMELYELMKRTQAHDHLLKGGIVQPEVESAKIRRGTDAILLTEEDLANIAGTLTDRQVQIADGLQRLTCGLLADYGNRASMDAYGYKKFTEQSYWPIQSAKEGIRSSVERGSGQTRSIANIGFAQAVTPHANNPLDLPGLFSTFSSHAGDMIDYAAWLLPMEDANRLFNFKFRDGEGNLTGKTVKGLLERVGGEGSQRYWHNLMEDIQNGINAPGDSPMWDKIGKSIGNFKGAAVGGNLRVVIQQPTAFFRAAAVLSPADLSRGLAGGVTRGNGWKKALQYSPIAKRKNTGSFDISSPRQMNEILFDDRTPVRKLNDTLSAPAGMADAVTWGRLWNACEWATAREHKSLQKGSEAFYQKVNELFTEVIDQTQVVDGVLQRSNIMRSSNAVVKQATSFMGEPIMSLNLMLRAYDQVRYEQDRKKWRQAVKTLGRAATALVVTNVINALAQSLIDAMRDDDEDKKYWERFWAAFTGIAGEEENFQDYLTSVMSGNLGSGLNPLGQIPFVKDVLSLLQGYDVSRTDMEIISDIVDASELFISSAGGGGSKTTAYAVKSLLAAMAKLFGIPVSNLTRDIWSIARSTAVETDNIPLQYEMEKAIYNITNERNKGRYYDILFRALAQGDIDSYEHIRRELMEQMGVDGASIDSAMRSRYKNAMEKNPNFTLSQEAMDLTGARENYASEKSDTERFGPDDLDAEAYRDYSRQQAEDYREWADRIEAFKGFDWLDDEAKDSILKAAQQLAQDTALRDYSGGQFTDADLSQWERWATGGSEYGVTEAEAILFKAAYDMAESEKDEEGKTVSGSKKENTIELAEELMPYLTDQELEYLMAQFWTPEDDALKERKEKKFMD